MESPRGISARTRNPSPGRFGRNWTHGRGLRSKKIHPFNLAVQKLAGRGDYYCEHALTDTDELAEKVHDVVGDVTARTFLQNFFSQKFGQTIVLGNICCSSCVISSGPIEEDLMFKIQMTAVNLDPNNLPS